MEEVGAQKTFIEIAAPKIKSRSRFPRIAATIYRPCFEQCLAARHCGALPEVLMLDPLLSDRDVERITGRARSTLQKDRVAGIGIPFVRFGRLVRYRQSDVTAFLEGLPSCRSTSEKARASGQ
jgi:hypothetical protein